MATVKNAADSQKVRSQKEKEILARENELKDLNEVLELPAGRRVLWRMLSAAGIYRQSARDSGSWTYFNEGQRSVGLNLLNDIMEVNPDKYLEMIKEERKSNAERE